MKYVCGPMSGLPEYNWPMFKYATQKLRDAGEEAVCPTEINHPTDGKSWVVCLKLCIIELMRCDEIVYLPGWQNSRGATLEMLLAWVLGFIFHEVRIINPEHDDFLLRDNYAPTLSMIVSAFLRCHFGKVFDRA